MRHMRADVCPCCGSVSPPARSADVIALTDRQRLICARLSSGQSDKQIARVLDVSQRTIEAEKNRIAKRLGLQTSQVLIWAVENRAAFGDPLRAPTRQISHMLSRPVVDHVSANLDWSI